MPQGVVQSVEELLRRRRYGADAISGISFQILCAIRESLALFRSDPTAEVRLEGIEDVDLLSRLATSQMLLQMKHSTNPWQPSSLRKALESFLEALRLDHGLRFALLLSGPMNASVAKASSGSLSEQKSDAIDDLILRALQLRQHTADTTRLAAVLHVVRVNREGLEAEIVQQLAQTFNFGTGSVVVFARLLAAEYLDWSSKRLTITQADVVRIHHIFSEELAKEQNYQAIGRGLITRIDWTVDSSANDFIEGKRTRPGHVAAGLDVPRATWIERITKALEAVPVCAIRASSGQGKSTLLFRYGFEHGQQQDTYIVRSLQTTEELSAVREFLQFRTRFQGSILLLIDNADWRTRLWSSLATDCGAMPLKILVSTRMEDWTRYADTTGFGYEVVEPSLDEPEATDIFRFLTSHGRVHASVPSHGYAWEKLGKPRLLIEYVYLVSHGTLLRERLSDQIATISRQQEDPGKLEALRIAVLSSVCGCEVPLRSLVDAIRWRDDPSFALGTLNGEYISISATDVEGLHLVRSQHLAELLHSGVHPLDRTAIQCIQILDRNRHRDLLSAIFAVDGLDAESFWLQLLGLANAQEPSILLDWLDGLFYAGEGVCAASFSEQFAHVTKTYGRASASILALDMVPFHGTDVCASMARIFPDQKDIWQTLGQYVSAAKTRTRGIDFVTRLLKSLVGTLDCSRFEQPYHDVGRLLGWCVLAQVQWPGWDKAKDYFLSHPQWSEADPNSVALFIQNLYRYDLPAFESWWARWRDVALAYFRLHTWSVEAKEESGTVSVAFIPDDGVGSVNDQAMTRLRTARQMIPCARAYESRAIWFIPGIGTPIHDESIKRFDASAQPWPSDVTKNRMWLDAVESQYRADSYYVFFYRWHRYRTTALALAEELTKVLDKRFARKNGNTGGFQKVMDEWQDANIDIDTKPPKQARSVALETFEKTSSAWSASIRNFCTQIVPALIHTDGSKIRLACHNFREAQAQLLPMHRAFERFHEAVPDYFDSKKLAVREIRAYDSLSWRVIALEHSDPAEKISDPGLYGRRWAAQQERSRNEAIAGALLMVGSVVPRFKVLRQGILWYAAVECTAANCKRWNEAITHLASVLNGVAWVADIFLLIPHIEGTIRAGAVQWSADRLQALANGSTLPSELLYPSPLDSHLLSEIPFALKGPPPEATLTERILSLPSHQTYCQDLYSQTTSLAQSPHEFDRQLYARYQARIENLISEFSAEVTALLREVESRGNCERLIELLTKLANGQYGSVSLADLLLATDDELPT